MSASSTATAPGYGGAGQGIALGVEWGNIQTGRYGVGYMFYAEAPYHLMHSVDAIENTPLTSGAINNPVGNAQLLSNVASVRHDVDPAVVDHYSVQRVIDLDCAVSGRDLGSATNAVQREIASPLLTPPASEVPMLLAAEIGKE